MIFKNLNFFFIKVFFLFLLLNFQNSNSIENEIKFKINNEIVTSIDIKNEISLLTSLNPKLLELTKKKISKIATNSIVNEKIKKIEISKYKKDLNIDENYLSRLIENSYKKLNFKSETEFKNYLKKKEINLKEFKEKLIIEALWNEIIFNKYKSKIYINENEIKKEILENNEKESLSYNLSEIVFDLKQDEKLEFKNEVIKKEIFDKGFENTASIYSISSSSSLGGKIGWIAAKSLNKNLVNKISKLKIGEFSEPHVIPGGFLILKLNDLRKIEKNINLDEEIKTVIKLKTNQQLNQYSNIYFNKIKKDLLIEKI